MTTGDLSFSGDVSKLIQIGTSNGPVFVLNQQPVKERIRRVPDAIKITADQEEEIIIFVVSKRFGRRVKMSVPPGIRAAALTETLVDLLTLPRNYRIDELLLELVFRYTILFKGERIGPFSPLDGSGVYGGSEVELLIEFGWKDPISPSPETTWGRGGEINFTER